MSRFEMNGILIKSLIDTIAMCLPEILGLLCKLLEQFFFFCFFFRKKSRDRVALVYVNKDSTFSLTKSRIFIDTQVSLHCCS